MPNDLILSASVTSDPPSEVMALSLVKRAFEAGLQELAQIVNLDRLRELQAQTAAVEHYLARFVRNRDAYLRCQQMMAELRLRTERQIGLWLACNVNHHGGGDRRSESRNATAVGDLPEGITKSQSWRLQRIAAVPEVVLERYIVSARDKCKEITTTGLLRQAQEFRPGPGATHGEPRVTGSRTAEALSALVRRGLRFGTIYADPPWPYQNTATRGAANNHYPTMTVEQIKALPVLELADDSSHCHLWTTNAFLPEALEVLASWGFDYKGMSLWVKERVGLGNYWRVAHELLLLGTRRNYPFRDRSQRSWQCIEPGRHSAKPGAVREIIELVSPPPYLELFGRHLVEGWTVWGNEVGGMLVDATSRSDFTSGTEGDVS